MIGHVCCLVCLFVCLLLVCKHGKSGEHVEVRFFMSFGMNVEHLHQILTFE